MGIELKYGKTNNQTVHQKRFQGYWQCAGYKYALCRSLEDFIKVVRDYMLAVDYNILLDVKSYHLSDDDTEHNKQVLNKIIKTRSNMKKRYFYVVASFMRKDIAKTQSKVDLTIMKEDGSALFPLMEAIKVISEGYSEIADPATIQFDNYFEISKEDYEAFNKAKNLIKVNK